ncbi:hypothetical protein BCR33DRAFT_362922 [Rhizoclosmatium globosum]|uniref:Uncharacterized protein n=1 Tax=Rhizoclosmatium globosum TaxID=329046 RepID=A0A1Y2BZZ9_9FUNG|nr:hypothetical protein BCR33DRAFT_362922 [Rhizoclosmatium globosum]|eukprot:ORY40362.1 hypothetical protein BCR33DRAFT_362922 [Rhizoclosmatium globosum]
MCNEVPDIETGTLCTVPDYRKDKVHFIASFGRITSLAHVPPSCYENLPQHVLIELTTRPRHFITCKRITGNNTVTVFCYPMGPLFCDIRPQRRGRNIEKGYKWTYEGFDLLFNQYAVGFQIGLEEENRVGGYTHPRDGCKRFWIETNEADRLIGYFLEVQTRQMELDDKRGLLEIYCPVDNGVGEGGNDEIATIEGGGTMEVDALEGGPSSQETLVEAAREVNESPVVKAVLRKRGSAMMDSGTSDKKTESKKAKVEYEIVPSPVKPQGSPSSFQEVDIPLPPSSDLGETPKAAPVAASSAPLSLSNSDNNVIPKERRKLAVPKFMNGKLMKQASEVGNEEN